MDDASHERGGPMLRQGIPHRREAGDEVVWTGEGAQRVEEDTPTLIIAHGIADGPTAKKVMTASQFCRQLTPAIPVAIEVCAGDGDGQYEDVKGAPGAKRSVAKPTTWRVPVAQVVNGAGHTLLLCYTQDKEQEKAKQKGQPSTSVRVWGENASGQLGLGHNRPVQSLTAPIPFFRQPQTKCGVKMIAAGGAFSMAVLKDGRAVVWGNNEDGQLGLGLLGGQMLPRRRGEAWCEVNDFVVGGTLARSERVLPGDRIHGWQVGSRTQVRLQALPESCEDQPLGIQELLEEELLELFAHREKEIARLRAEIAALEERIGASLKQEDALETRYEEELDAVVRRFRMRKGGLEEEFAAKLRGLRAAADLERVEDDERILRMRAVLDGVLWGLGNGAHAQAAGVWRAALEECEGRALSRRKNAQAARAVAPKDEKGALEEVVKLVLTCVAAKNLPKMDLLGTCDAYVEVELGGQHRKSSVKKNSYSPTWNEEFELEARGGELLLRVCDWDFVGSNDLVGQAQLAHAELMAAADAEETRELELRKASGEAVVDKHNKVSVLTVKFRVEVQRGAHRLRTSAASRQPKLRVLVTRITAAHLPKMDTFGKCDAFCELLLGGERVKTEVKRSSYAPSWEQDITMETKGGDLVVRVSDWDQGSANDLIGNVHVAHDELLAALGREQKLCRELRAPDGATVVGHDGSPAVVTVFWKCEMLNRDGSASAVPPELNAIKKFNFVFRCVSASHLPKMDTIGSCDPFVEIEIGHQKVTTAVKKSTLEPSWNEDFELEANGGELLLRVMDWDRFGKNDLVGSTRLRHDQLFGPVGKHEDLDLELAAADGSLLVGKDGHVSILKISWTVTEVMENRQRVEESADGPSDVVQQQAALSDEGVGAAEHAASQPVQVFVRCVGAKHLPKVDTFGLCDPFVELQLGGVQMQTKVVKNTLDPSWEEKFELEARGDDLLLRVMDWDRLSKNELVGSARVSHERLLEAARRGEEEELPLVGGDGVEVFGKDGKAAVLLVQVTLKPGSGAAEQEQAARDARGRSGQREARKLPSPPPKPDDPASVHKTLEPPPTGGGGAQQQQQQPEEEKPVPLSVKVLEGEHLPKMDTLGSCDPFVELELGGQKRQTSVKKNTYTPAWDEEFELDAKGFDLVVRVFDWDRGSKNDLVGEGRVGHEEMMHAVGSGEHLFGVELAKDGKAVKGKDKRVAVVRIQIRAKRTDEHAAPTPATGIPGRGRRRSSLTAGGIPLRIWLTCTSASHLPKMDFMGKCDGFCEIEVGGQREKTHVIKNSYDPEWNETFEFEARGGDLRIRVMDWDLGSGNDMVGDAFISHAQMMEAVGKETKMFLELKASDGSVVKGHDKETTIVTVSLKSEPLNARRKSSVEGTAFVPKLVVTCVSANNLPKTDTFGSCDPFVELEMGSQKAATEVKKNTLAPEWMQSFEMEATGSDLLVRVMDWDRLNKNDLVGSAQIAHDLLVGSAGQEQERELELVGAKGDKVMGKDGRWAVVTIRWRFQESAPITSAGGRRPSVSPSDVGFMGWIMSDLLWFRGEEVPLKFSDSLVVRMALKSATRELSMVESEVYSDQKNSCDPLKLRLTQEAVELTVKLFKEDGSQRRTLLGESSIPSSEILHASESSSFDGKPLGYGQKGGFSWTRVVHLQKRPYHEFFATFRFVFSVVYGLDGAQEEKEYRRRCLEKLEALERREHAEAAEKLEMKLQVIATDYAGRRERVEAVYFIKGKRLNAKHADAVAALEAERNEMLREAVRRHGLAQRILERRHGDDVRTGEMVQLDLDLDAQCKKLEAEAEERLERCRSSARRQLEAVECEMEAVLQTARDLSSVEVAEHSLWFQKYREELLATVDGILGEAQTRMGLVSADLEKEIEKTKERLAAAEHARREKLAEEEAACEMWRAEKAEELEDEREAKVASAAEAEGGQRTAGDTEQTASRKEMREQAAALRLQLAVQLAEGSAQEGAEDAGLQLVVSKRVGLGEMAEEEARRRVRERGKERETLPAEELREEWVRVRRGENQPVPVQQWVMDVVTSGRGVREVSCGARHAMAVTADGELWAWGRNAHGELGLGDRRRRWIPRQVRVPGRVTTVKSVGCGDGYSMAVLLGEGGGTVVMGWGRNDRDQLGLNQAGEVRAWLRRMARPTGWRHPQKEGVRFQVERGDEVALRLWEVGVASWGSLARLGAAEVAAIAGDLALPAPSAESLQRARREVKECYPSNVRSAQGEGRVRWEYSAWDHLEGVVVPQGVLITREGQAVFNLGADVAGVPCECGPHAGMPTASIRCGKHGPPVRWTRDMAQLNVYPPEVATGVERTKGGPVVTSKRLAKELEDIVRVGVYPQDTGLASGGAPHMQAGLKNVQDGPQHGTEYVRLQVLRLEESFLDPMQTSDNNFFFDGAVHFPYFHPGRKPVERVLCGREYTVVQLESGELRFLGSMLSAVARLQDKPARRPRHGRVKAKARRELMKPETPASGFHFQICDAYEEVAYSLPVQKESLLVRAVRGAQRPRSLLRITFSQLQHLSFPHHTP